MLGEELESEARRLTEQLASIAIRTARRARGSRYPQEEFMAETVDVIARYGNWYRGADDLFTHCLILKNGQCWLLGQGLAAVTLRNFKAPASQFEKLAAALETIPVEWAKSSYIGYNFITDAEGPAASEIAVYGVQDGSLPGYFVSPLDSDAAKLVKEIADIDGP
jgi:hypothetical protein